MELFFKPIQDSIETRWRLNRTRLLHALGPLEAAVLHLLMHLVQPLQRRRQTIGGRRKPQAEALHLQPRLAITPRQWPPQPQPLAALLKPQAHSSTAQAAIELFEALGRQR